jgi:hypothetical protein
VVLDPGGKNRAISYLARTQRSEQISHEMSNFHPHLVSYLLQLQAKYIPNMAKNSPAQCSTRWWWWTMKTGFNGGGGVGGSVRRR